MGELKGIAQYEVNLMRDRLHAQALHRRNISLLKREVQREAQEMKKLLGNR